MSTDYKQLLLRFPEQLTSALRSVPVLSAPPRSPQEVVYCGMGGSGIAGDICQSAFYDSGAVPFIVVKDYQIPGHVGKDSLVILSSYSGTTEETLAAGQEARRRGCMILTLSCDERITEVAGPGLIGHIPLPPGLQPRQALAYPVVGLYLTLSNLLLSKSAVMDVEEAISWTATNGQRLANPDQFDEFVKDPEAQILVYSSARMFPAAVRWKGQLAENAKLHAFASPVPEMNHNEIMGWEPNSAIRQKVALLIDKGDHPRVQKRFEFLMSFLANRAHILVVYSHCQSLFARLLSLIYTGDWLSLHLAAARGIDPVAIQSIMDLKSYMAQK